MNARFAPLRQSRGPFCLTPEQYIEINQKYENGQDAFSLLESFGFHRNTGLYQAALVRHLLLHTILVIGRQPYRRSEALRVHQLILIYNHHTAHVEMLLDNAERRLYG